MLMVRSGPLGREAEAMCAIGRSVKSTIRICFLMRVIFIETQIQRNWILKLVNSQREVFGEVRKRHLSKKSSQRFA